MGKGGALDLPPRRNSPFQIQIQTQAQLPFEIDNHSPVAGLVLPDQRALQFVQTLRALPR